MPERTPVPTTATVVIVNCKNSNLPCPQGPTIDVPQLNPGGGGPGIMPNPEWLPTWLRNLDNFFLAQGGQFRVMMISQPVQSDLIMADLGQLQIKAPSAPSGKGPGGRPGAVKPGKAILNVLENVAEGLIREHGDELADVAMKQAEKVAGNIGKGKAKK